MRLISFQKKQNHKFNYLLINKHTDSQTINYLKKKYINF